MIALLATVALAGSFGTPCDFHHPIAGTAGFANGLEAVRTNTNTYGAGEFARRRLRQQTYMAMDMHMVFGVAQVPAYCTSDDDGKYAETVYSQPLDVAATNLGLNLPVLEGGPLNSSARVFYASSVTNSTMGFRGATAVAPMFNLYPAFAAPFVGNSAAGRGLSTYTVDWIGGATLRSDVVTMQAGYTGTRGLYLDLTQEKVAVFFNSVFQGGVGIDDLGYLMGGVERFDPLEIGLGEAKHGVTSLFYREVPLAGGAQSAAKAEAEGGALQKLRTGHLRQEDLFQRFDLRLAWQLGQGAGLRELAVAVHSDNWLERRKLKMKEGKLYYARAGVVRLPDQPLLGVEGGLRPTLRADYIVRNGSAYDNFAVRLSLRMNDPDLLDLYPFAYNALSINVELSGRGGEP